MKATESNLLGICIPTYNRQDYLRQNLNSVLTEVSKFNLPIYISDNASEDGTENMIYNFKAVYENIMYNRNPENIGLYCNILKVIRMAKTDYIWLMGDDDAINKKSIEQIICYLKKGYDFIRLNSTQYDKNLEKTKLDKVISCSTNKIYPSGTHEELLVDLKWGYYGFISSMIIKRQLLSDLISKYEDKEFMIYNNIWFPTAIFYEAVVGRCGIFLCEPIVIMRDNPRPDGIDIWSHSYTQRLKMIEYLHPKGYSTKTLKKAMDFTIISTVMISITSRCKDKNAKLYNKSIIEDKFIPLHVKSIIFIIGKMPLFLTKKMEVIINKLQ